MTERCCSEHHYTCAASFDEYPPVRCCDRCPCGPLPTPVTQKGASE